MIPDAHFPEEWLVAHAAGTLTQAEALVVATHLTLCPRCREQVDLAAVAAARVAARGPALPLDPGGVDALLSRLDDTGDDEPLEPPPAASDGVLPWPILRHTGPLDQLRWTWLAPYTYGVDLPVPTGAGLPLRLVRMSAGSHMPHRHTGREVGVILQGGWTDQWGHHDRGDVAIVEDRDSVHDQRIDRGVDCVALVLNDSPAVPAVPLGKWLARFLKI